MEEYLEVHEQAGTLEGNYQFKVMVIKLGAIITVSGLKQHDAT